MSQRELFFFSKTNFNSYRKEKELEGFEVISIARYFNNLEDLSIIDSSETIIDISTISALKDIQYFSEQIIDKFDDDIVFIADIQYKELFSHSLRYCFDYFTDLDDTTSEEDEKPKGNKLVKALKHKKITDLNGSELNQFMNNFCNQIYGHEKFKDDFIQLVQTFRVFNKLREHKILSLFLMGDSGVGKTEVARAIHKSLGGEKKLAKVNFGNYSSEFSLSSLIGSARGYIGSEDGEIFMRVRDSDTGIILIDEFEKSNATLFNYFLDVLENGKMVSSQAEEIDLNGFIIIFTSNISKKDFTSRISPELRSRFDYKCLFTVLYSEDKQKFVEFRIDNIFKKFKESFDYELNSELRQIIISRVDVDKFSNMRDLNKAIKSEFVSQLPNYLTNHEIDAEIVNDL